MATENPHMKQSEIAENFGIERSTVSKILAKKDKWLRVSDNEMRFVAKLRYPLSVSHHNPLLTVPQTNQVLHDRGSNDRMASGVCYE